MENEAGGERVSFIFSLEITQLGETLVSKSIKNISMLHHYGFSTIAIASKRNYNSTCSLISREEVIIEVDTCVLALANVLILVKNEGEVACNGAFMD